jgi:hypothetical protein
MIYRQAPIQWEQEIPMEEVRGMFVSPQMAQMPISDIMSS